MINIKRELTKNQTVVILIAAIMVFWELAAIFARSVIHLNMADQRLPYFHRVIAALASNFPELASAALSTMFTAAIGFVIGGLIGYIFALIMNSSQYSEKVIFPYLIVLQMIPSLALAPIIFSIVKDADRTRIIVSAFVTFFPTAVNVLQGMKSVQKDRLELMHICSANKFQLYGKLIIPNSLPELFTGLKISAPRAVTAAILVEMLGTTNGIGIKMLYCLYYGERNANLFWACVLVAVMLGVGAYVLIIAAEKLLLKNRG